MKGVLAYTDQKVVSTDFRGESCTSVFDADAGIRLASAQKLQSSVNPAMALQLRQAGIVRELIRTINQIRKEQGLTLKDVVTIEYHTNYAAFKDVLAKYSEEILRATLAKKLVSSAEPSQKFEIEGAEIKILVRKDS